jgi:hypothetical protein
MEEKSKITGTNGIKIEQQQQPQLPKSFVRCKKGEIAKCVLRCKLSKLRHLVLPEAIDSEYLDSLFPKLVELFDPQPVVYNGGIANIRNWKISCYLEVMDGGIPTAEPNVPLLELFRDLLDACNDLFLFWYRQQHACNYHRGDDNDKNASPPVIQSCRRLMTFITRYTPAPGEQALLKVCMHSTTNHAAAGLTHMLIFYQHVDGAGKVDGSCVMALPTQSSFEGGGLTFWDGGRRRRPVQEIHYDTRAGDLAFIDRYVYALWNFFFFFSLHTSCETLNISCVE